MYIRVYNSTRECGAKYISESARPLKVHLGEYKRHVKEGKIDKSSTMKVIIKII